MAEAKSLVGIQETAGRGRVLQGGRKGKREKEDPSVAEGMIINQSAVWCEWMLGKAKGINRKELTEWSSWLMRRWR